jgi:arginase family enzyme
VGDDAAERALADVSCAYVALDCDVLDPGEIRPFMPEPAGLSLVEVERLLASVRERATVVGAGLTGLTPDAGNLEPLARLTAALGL